ncbi:MAG: V-type ATPase subunit [Synergistes sp.]|nr:V-type ATPase subunit [Synergistes sp.]
MMSRKEAYGYAAARIRAMEHRLLDAAVFARLLDAEDTASFLKVLSETSYSAEVSSISAEHSFDAMLERVLHDTYEEIASFVPDKELVTLLRLPYDFSNAKVLLKSLFAVKSGGKKRWDLLTSVASYPVDKLIADTESEEYRLLPFGLSSLYPKCISILEQNGDMLEVERILDEQMFKEMLNLAASLDIPEVTRWVRLKIDGENLRTMVRLKRFGFDSVRVRPFLHAGGFVGTEVLAPLVSEPMDTWGKAIDFSDLSAIFDDSESSADFSEVVGAMENKLDDFYYAETAKSKYSQDSPCNIVMYLLGKEQEIKNIRMIYVSKSGSWDNDKVRGLLRYVGN